MVTVDFADKSRDGTILLQPNNSMSWRDNLLFLGLVAVVSLVIATGFYIVGAKVILPFSMVEIVALFAGIYYCAWQRQRKELITFQTYQITVQKGFYKPITTHRYHRLWCQLVIRESVHPWKIPSVHIRSHGKELELGSFLNRQDKTVLIGRLQDLLLNAPCAPADWDKESEK